MAHTDNCEQCAVGRLALPLPFPQPTQPGDRRVNKRVQQPPNNPVHKKPLPIP